MTKPVIRYRAGKWVCRGAGHQGSSRSPVAAYCAWMVASSKNEAACWGYQAMRRKA